MKEIVDGGEVDECDRVLQQNVQRKQQDCERVNLDHCESDNSESWSRELFLVLQVVKEMVEVDQIIPLSVPSETELLMCQWRYNAKYQRSSGRPLEATVATRTRGVSMSTQITVATAVVSNEKVCEIIDDCEP